MRPDLYVDISAYLDGTAPEPDVLPVNDDFCLFYSGEFNLIYGDTESGKTWLCMAAIASILSAGGTAAVIDVDHNGVQAIVNRLQLLGVCRDVITDRDRFLLSEPTTQGELKAVIDDLRASSIDVVTIDSLGEVLPLFRFSSNSADDFTIAHAEVIKPLACAGAAVLVVDHLAKNDASREKGPTGSHAKTRAVGGLSVRVTAQREFSPGNGGAALLELNKDRHGGIRKHCPGSKPAIGTFELVPFGDTSLEYRFVSGATKRCDDGTQLDDDVTALRQACETKPSVRQARTILRCNNARAAKAVAAYDDPI